MVEALAYAAVAVSLLSMSMKDMLYLRFIHIASSLLYGFYGFLISATPLVLGAALFVAIHTYKIFQMKKSI